MNQVTGGEAVLVLPHAGQIKVLNGVGTFIWTALDGQQSIAEIANQMYVEYQVDIEQAQVDALEFLNDLDGRGILQVIES
ncbi:MAG TPA: PqqD family protein [Anaerolineales bacterium]|nr:PqqD family protein [Anaerolineales bacterium]